MAEEANKIVVANKRRQYGSDKDLVKLMGYKDIIERKLEKVTQLSNEITESIEDGQKYEEGNGEVHRC